MNKYRVLLKNLTYAEESPLQKDGLVQIQKEGDDSAFSGIR
jgi:hypothetical protein